MHSVALSSYPYVLIAFRVVSVNSSMETTTSSPARTCTHRRPFDALDCPTLPPLEVERVVVLFVVADSDGARKVDYEAAAAEKLIFYFLLLECVRARCLACRAFARTGLTVDWKYPKKKRSSYSCAHDSSTSLFQLVQGPFLGLLFRV